MGNLQEDIDKREYQILAQGNGSIIYHNDQDYVLKAIKNLNSNCRDQKQRMKRLSRYLQNEFEICSEIDHDNVIKCADFSYKKLINNEPHFSIKLPYYNEDFYDRYICKKLGSYEEIKKNLYKLADALYQCHSKQIAHNDIKLENILVSSCGQNFAIADFGMARKNPYKHVNEQREAWKCREMSYAAPEIWDFLDNCKNKKIVQSFDEKKSDVFALGIVFFLCMFGQYPQKLKQPDVNCPVYSMIINKEYEQFHNYAQKLNSFIEIPDDKLRNFVDLILGMQENQPNNRFSCKQILEHQFFN